MAKRSTKTGTNRTFRVGEKTLERLRKLAEALEISENACVSVAIEEMFTRRFPG